MNHQLSQSAARAERTFNPQRLRLARERRGLTKEALAQLCNVTRRAVTDWESGKVDEPRTDLLSQALNFSEDFFYGEDIAEVVDEDASFRAYTSMSARQSRSVLALASIVRCLSDWIDERYETPPVDMPLINDLMPAESQGEPDPVQSASSLRRMWGLGVRPVPDMVALLESHGIRVLALPDGIKEVDAFSYWNGSRPTVFLNLDKSAERLRFDLAHELGHVVMHRGIRTRGTRSFEIDANVFASSFLVPAEGLIAQIRSRPSLSDAFVLKKYWRVSATAMVRRLHQLGIINDWQYRTWMVDLSSRGFRASEPGGIERESSPLLGGVLTLAREDGWSLTRISHELKIPLDDLEGVLAGLTVVPLTGGGEGSPNSSAIRGDLRIVSN